MSASSEVYGFTGGRIALGGISTGTSGWRGIATQVYNWGTQGARDAENNAFYDVSRRMERGLAVLSCVGTTYEEKRQAHAFTSVDWHDAAHAEHLARLGYGDTNQQRANQMLNTTQWKVQDGKHAGETVNIAAGLTKDQLSQLTATGSFVDASGRHITSVNGARDTRQIMRAAAEEKQRNSKMFDAIRKNQARDSLQQLGVQQKKLLTDVAAQYGKKFNGSQKDIQNLEKTLRQERDKIIRMGGNTTKLDIQISDLNIAKQTGLSRGAGDTGEMAVQRRNYGRQIIVQSVMGDDMNQGIVFYRNAANLTRQSATLALRTTVGIATKTAALPAGIVGSLASDTMIGRKAKDIKDKANNVNEKAKDFGRKKSSSEKRTKRKERADNRHNNRAQKFDAKTLEIDDKIHNLEEKKSKQKGKLSEKDKQQLDKLKAQKDRRTKRGGKKELRQQRKINRKKFRSKILTPVNKVKLILNAINPLRIWDLIKKKFQIFIGTGLIIFILFMVACAAGGALIPYLVCFISDVSTDLTGALDDVNYVQYIVNETAIHLGTQVESVAKNDAETHFLVEDPVPSDDGIDWYKTVSEGEIRHIWDTNEMRLPEDQRKELSGLSANLLQITSLMHYRYQDDLGFEEYPTAKAYEYYMYVRTHRVAEDANGNRTYSYEDLDNCAVTALYAETPSYNPGTQVVTRGDELCENLYVHGYNNFAVGSDASLALAINKARATMEGFLTTCVKNIAVSQGIDPSASADRRGQGLWLNEIPYDDSGVCNNYTAYPAGYTDAYLYTTDEGGNCPGEEHTHTPWTSPDSPGCYDTVYTGAYYPDGVTEITRAGALTCGLEEHTHSQWHSEYDSGCYETAYLCNGHCGGHICPTVDMVVDMKWEDIVRHDNFKTPYFVAESSFSSILNWGNCRTIDAWAEKWMDRASEWFAPFPDSYATAYAWYGRTLVYKRAGVIDQITNGAPEETPAENTDDVYGFDGWFHDDGSIDASLIAELEDFYGTYDTDFEDGVEAWKDFEVVFPSGSCPKLTDAEIQAVLEQVKLVNPGISMRRLAVIEEALKGVGQYYYSLCGSAHMNAINNTSGAGECSGFVSGVLNRALGTNYNTSAAGYHDYGSATAMQAGDIIASKQQTENATGHVLIYVGYLPDGIPGYKIAKSDGVATEQAGPSMYVIDCTPKYGGSVFRKYSNFSGLNAWGGY